MSQSQFFWKIFYTAVVLVIALGVVQFFSGAGFVLGLPIFIIVVIGGLALVAAVIAGIWEQK